MLLITPIHANLLQFTSIHSDLLQLSPICSSFVRDLWTSLGSLTLLSDEEDHDENVPSLDPQRTGFVANEMSKLHTLHSTSLSIILRPPASFCHIHAIFQRMTLI